MRQHIGNQMTAVTRVCWMVLTDPALHATWADALEDSYRVRDKLRAASKLLDDAEAAEFTYPCLEDLVAVAAVAVAGLGIGRR